MRIIKDYPKYTISLDPEDLNTFEEPIGESDLTKEPITLDCSKIKTDKRPSDNKVCKFIADTLGLSLSYTRAHFYPELMTWGRLKEFVNKVVPDHAEISTIEIHNHDEPSMSVNIERVGDGTVIIDQGY